MPSPTQISPEEVERLHAVMGAQGQADAPALVAAASTAARLSRWSDVVHLAQAALVLDPHNARAWGLVGQAAEAAGRFPDARRAFETAVGLDDRDMGLALAAARAQANTGAVSPARALLTYVLLRSSSQTLRSEAQKLLDTLPSDPGAGP